MSTIKRFSNENLAELQRDLREDLDIFSDDYDLKVDINNTRASEGEVSFGITFRPKDTTLIEQSLAPQFRMMGIREDAFGKVFISRAGGQFKVTGITPRRTKYPIDAERVPDGRKYKFKPSQIGSWEDGKGE